MKNALLPLVLSVTTAVSAVLTPVALSQGAAPLPTSARELAATAEAQQRIDLVAEWYRTRDYTLLAETLDWRHAPGFFGGERLTSRAQVESQLVPFYSQVFDNIEVEIERIEAGQQAVFSMGTYLLTPKNSTQVYRAPFIHVWTVNDDGQLSGLVQYADTQLISDALEGARVLTETAK